MIFLVLMNVIYFKGDWVSKFKEVNIYLIEFMCGDGKIVEVEMMF